MIRGDSVEQFVNPAANHPDVRSREIITLAMINFAFQIANLLHECLSERVRRWRCLNEHGLVVVHVVPFFLGDFDSLRNTAFQLVEPVCSDILGKSRKVNLHHVHTEAVTLYKTPFDGVDAVCITESRIDMCRYRSLT